MRRVGFAATVAMLVAVCALAWPRPADGLLLPLGPVQLVWGSARIVQGHVVSTAVRWQTEPGASAGTRGTIVTDVSLRIDDVLRGEAPSSLTITVPGGAIGPWRVEVEDAAAFETGSDYLVFLNASGGVVGWQQGNPPIVDDMVPAFGSSLAVVKAGVEGLGTLLDNVGARLATLRLGVEMLQHGLLFVTSAGSATSPGGLAADMLRLGDAARTGIADLPGRVWLLPGGDDLQWMQVPGASDVLAPAVTSPESGGGPSLGLTVPAPAPVERGGTSRTRGAAPPDYPADADSWMVHGPLDLSAAADARLSFRTWRRLPLGLDQLVVACSIDGRSFSGYTIDGDSEGFERYRLSLKDWPLLGDLDGRRRVWIAFGFQSDGLAADEGVYVDAVRLTTSRDTLLDDDFEAADLRGWRTYGQPGWSRSTHRSYRGAASAYCSGRGVRVAAVRPDRRAAGIGATVTVTGSGFGRRPGKVEFFYRDGKPRIRGPVVTWSDERIVCRVPVGIIENYYASAGSGPLWVTTAAGVACEPRDFRITFSWGLSWWPSGRVPFRVNVTEERFLGAVRRAAATWNASGADFRFSYGGPTGHDDIATDFQNDIIWRTVDEPGVIAFARPISYRGCIVEVDQVFNSTMSWGDGSRDTMDVETICLHELGHWLMLRDLYGDGDDAKVMYGFGHQGKRARELTPGDRDGARWIYSHAERDVGVPVAAARPARGSTGEEVTLRFRVDDPPPSCGWALATVTVWQDGKKLAAEVAGLLEQDAIVRRVGRWVTYGFDCVLPAGRYVYRVAVRDLAGHEASAPAEAELVIE